MEQVYESAFERVIDIVMTSCLLVFIVALTLFVLAHMLISVINAVKGEDD